MISRDMFPVFCVSAEKDMCVRRFMEFLVNVAPSAAAMPGMTTGDGRLVPYDVKGMTSALFSALLSSRIWEILIILK